MNLVILTESGVEVPALPDDGVGIVVWFFILAMFVGVYVLISRSRQRTHEHYMEAQRRAAERRAADSDDEKD